MLEIVESKALTIRLESMISKFTRRASSQLSNDSNVSPTTEHPAELRHRARASSKSSSDEFEMLIYGDIRSPCSCAGAVNLRY